VNPHLTDVDPYRGTLAGVDELVRNLAAVGARLDSIADNLNLPNPQKPAQMGRIEMAAKALGDAARALGVPFVSGNVSMYNESSQAAIPPTPTLLGVGIVQDVRRAQTTDLKEAGHALYHAGTVRDEMGGSHWFLAAGGESTQVPTVDVAETKRAAEAVVSAIEKGLVAASHDVGMGGLAVALAEMCMGGDLGASVDVARLGALPDDVLLFSESSTRWLLEARDPVALETHFRDAGVPLALLGTTGGAHVAITNGPRRLVEVEVAAARREFAEAMHRRMG
jgi:phosphoribosylformylglycinamidine synthase